MNFNRNELEQIESALLDERRSLYAKADEARKDYVEYRKIAIKIDDHTRLIEKVRRMILVEEVETQ